MDGFVRNRGENWDDYYERYMQSAAWEHKRKLAMAAAGEKCQLCARSDRALHVHHNDYERLGNELLTDLVVLCVDCHEKFHGKPIGNQPPPKAGPKVVKSFAESSGFVVVGARELADYRRRKGYAKKMQNAWMGRRMFRDRKRSV